MYTMSIRELMENIGINVSINGGKKPLLYFYFSDLRSRRCQPYAISSEMVNDIPIVIAYCPFEKSKRTPKLATHRSSSTQLVFKTREPHMKFPEIRGTRSPALSSDMDRRDKSFLGGKNTREREKKSVSIPGREFVQPLSRHIIAS